MRDMIETVDWPLGNSRFSSRLSKTHIVEGDYPMTLCGVAYTRKPFHAKTLQSLAMYQTESNACRQCRRRIRARLDKEA